MPRLGRHADRGASTQSDTRSDSSRAEPGSHWSPKNRAMARRMLDAGRITAAGIASLPSDL